MKWPLSWYVEERTSAPDAYWAQKTAELNAKCGNNGLVFWTRGVLVGPEWWRTLIGDRRKPLIKRKEGE